jgi:hypothetical protein
MGKMSRNKGSRGEREVRELLGKDFKRTGYAGISNPDVSSSWAVVSVKNKAIPISLKKALQEIILLEAQAPDKEHYVAVKVNHRYLIIQKIEQFRDARC